MKVAINVYEICHTYLQFYYRKNEEEQFLYCFQECKINRKIKTCKIKQNNDNK